MCPAQGHNALNAVLPVRLEPATPKKNLILSQGFITEPLLCSQTRFVIQTSGLCF